jgi:hypothetical protein
MMDEFPHRPVVDLEPALGQLGDQAAQGEPSRVNPLQKPQPVLTDDFGRPIATHLARRRTAGRPQPLRPPHDACGTDAQGSGNHANTLSPQNPFDHPLTQIHRQGLRHSWWPPNQSER